MRFNTLAAATTLLLCTLPAVSQARDTALYLPFDIYAYARHRHWMEAVVVAVNLLVDLLYPWLDPRISHTPKVS